MIGDPRKADAPVARGEGGQAGTTTSAKSTAPHVDLSNLSHAEIATAKLLHEQGVAWWIACLFIAWRRQFPKTHIGPKGSALIAEAAAAGRAKRRGGGQ